MRVTQIETPLEPEDDPSGEWLTAAPWSEPGDGSAHKGSTEDALVFARRRLEKNGDGNLFPVVREMNSAGYRRPNGLEWTAHELEQAGVRDSKLAAVATARADATEPPAALSSVHEAFREHVLMPDPGMLDTTLATYAAHRQGGDEPWMLLVDPPSNLKTEVLLTLKGLPGVRFVGELTSHTLASGMKGKENQANRASLLVRMEARGDDFLVNKDLTGTLKGNRDERGRLFGQLRDIYDGEFMADFGTGVEVQWEGRLGFISGVTPIIDRFWSVNAVLGERWLYRRGQPPPRNETARKALQQTRRGEMREQLRAAVHEFVGGLDFTETFVLSEPAIDRLVCAADFVTRARTTVERDGYHREIQAVPEPEGPARFVKQVQALIFGFMVMKYDEDGALARAIPTAFDSLPPIRMNTLSALRGAEGSVTTPDLEERLELPESTLRRELEDLQALGMVRRNGGSGGYYGASSWELKNEFQSMWDASETEGEA
jgi:hypothetical protein